MQDYAKQNKLAWEYDAYRFWVEHNGAPSEAAARIMADPVAALKRYARYFDTIEGLRIANICGSCGKRAVPLALLGASATVFDISEDNRRYAVETAEAAGVQLEYVVGDVLETELSLYGGSFDTVFMEGGILHYFPDVLAFMRLMHALLKPGGRMICSDFHPFQKIADVLSIEQPPMDYFSTGLIDGEMAHAHLYPPAERACFPRCVYRKYTLSEIINAVIESGFTLRRFDEHPSWANAALPGEFTLVAVR